MKFVIVLLLSYPIFSGCENPTQNKHSRPLDIFVFSYSQENKDFSIKFTSSDTIFIQKRFPEPTEIFYSIIAESQAEKIDSFIEKFSLLKKDSIYFENNLSDGSSYKFYLIKDNNINWVSIYGRKAPKFLYEFGDWLIKLKEQLRLTQTKKQVDFGNLNYFLLPQIDSTTLKNGR